MRNVPKWSDTFSEIFKVCLTILGHALKSESHLAKVGISPFFIYSNESPLKVMKNAFYFILKSLFVIKIFKF